MEETKFKLIKISEEHYIVVDDSEIKEGHIAIDLCEDMGTKHEWFVVNKATLKYANQESKKITHSTQPLEIIKIDTMYEGEGWSKIIPLTLAEVEELIFGFSVEKMATELCLDAFPKHDNNSFDEAMSLCKDFYIEGFKAHQSLTKDKLFTAKDMINAYSEGTNAGACYESLVDYDSHDSEEAEEHSEREFNDFKQSLLPKTEWDVTFDEDGKLKLA